MQSQRTCSRDVIRTSAGVYLYLNLDLNNPSSEASSLTVPFTTPPIRTASNLRRRTPPQKPHPNSLSREGAHTHTQAIIKEKAKGQKHRNARSPCGHPGQKPLRPSLLSSKPAERRARSGRIVPVTDNRPADRLQQGTHA